MLARYYILPGGWKEGVEVSNNRVTVRQDAWIAKERDSKLSEPPTLWVRGGRVYDYKGDLGTVQEFEEDHESPEKEEDTTAARARRREQGMPPFPFVPNFVPKIAQNPQADELER